MATDSSIHNLFVVFYLKIIFFAESGVSCAVYHADLGQKIRREVHQRFVRDLVPVVVATVAFGMGIDKPGQVIFVRMSLISLKYLQIKYRLQSL